LSTFPDLKRKPELEALGIDSCLVKPLGASELEAAMRAKLRVAKTGSNAIAEQPKGRPRQATRSLKILVAEDTPFNQRFILRLLESWNHQAKLVENGRQALELLKKETYDIALMDVQMPEMDGLTATKEYRKWESGIRKAQDARQIKTENDTGSTSQIRNHISKISRLPILAMTAHAVKGDRERCLDAGMDQYISKPINSGKLFEAIEMLTQKSTVVEKRDAEFQTLEQELLLKAFDGDFGFMEEVVEVFLSDYPRLLDDIRRAVRDLDGDLLIRSAHSLKGMLRNFRADAAAEIAYDIEKRGKESDFDHMQAKLASLNDQIAQVDKHLRRMIKQQHD
jgi:CheY-like chemotaxis protein